MELDDFAVDPDLYENGKRVELGAGAHIAVRSASSSRAQKVRERLWKPYANWTKDLPEDITNRLNADWVAQGLLAEFAGFTVGGEPLEVDLSKAEDQRRLGEILARPKYKALCQRVRVIAFDEANFQAAADEATEKNSATSPAGGSGGDDRPKS